MTRHEKIATLSRRNLLKAGGALVIFVGTPLAIDTADAADDTTAVGAKPPLTPDQLSSYLAVNADGTVSAFFGKMDMGQGLAVAIRQMVAEELDVPVTSVRIFIGDTATSVNQGGASGSTGVQEGGRQMRMAAAEARRVLVEMAADKLGLAADRLTVTDGIVHAAADPANKISYAKLIGGRYFNVISPGTANTAIRSTPRARRNRKIPRITPSSGSPFRATILRRKCSRGRTLSPTSKFPAWCTAG